MSQENVEVVQASLEAWNAEDMDAFRELHHPTSSRDRRSVGRSQGRS